MSIADAQAVIGLPVGTGAAIPLERGRTCRYDSTKPGRRLDIFLRDASAYDTVAKTFGLTIAVPGVGDAALRDDNGVKLIARQGSNYVLIIASDTVRDSPDGIAPGRSAQALIAALSTIATKLLRAG